MQITVNGTVRDVQESPTVQDLLHHFELGEERVAIELNGNIVEPPFYSTITVEASDVLEIVRFVGGG